MCGMETRAPPLAAPGRQLLEEGRCYGGTRVMKSVV